MASANSTRDLDRRQAALDRASLERWQRQRKALDAISAYLEENPKERTSVLKLARQFGVSLA
jgi:AraC-like DNA-binding protein